MTSLLGAASTSTRAVRRHADYRCFMGVDSGPEVLNRVAEQLGAWLREKGLEPDLRESGLHRLDATELTVVRRETGSSSDLQAKLVEVNAHGTWRTSLTAHAPKRGPSWVTIDVTNDEGKFVSVPRVAKYIMDVIDARDGDGLMSSKPVNVRQDEVPELVSALTDPDRNGLIFVAATDDRLGFGPFASRVSRWTGEVYGLARVVVLDPPATQAFTARVGPAHAAPPWAIRTYQTKVDLDSPTDGRRHKILGTPRLAEQPDGSIRSLFGRIARYQASDRTLPTQVSGVLRAFSRLEDHLVVRSLTTGPEVPSAASADAAEAAAAAARSDTQVSPGAERYLAQIELTKALLGVDDLEESTLREVADLANRGRIGTDAINRITAQLNDRQAQIDELSDDLAFLKDLHEEEELEHAVTEEERSHLADENRWLRRRLAAFADHEAAYGQVPADLTTDYPTSFDELVDRLDSLRSSQVIFTGNPDCARQLDGFDSLDKLVRATWDVLLVLCDYCAARSAGKHDGAMEAYLQRTPRGYRQLSPQRHAATETRRTMNEWGDERVFPVPESVEPSGRVVMKAHFKLGRAGMVSPRLYYLDRWPLDRQVYVGYIGSHLTNTMS